MAYTFGKAFSRSAKHNKAITPFRPYDANIFTEDDFVASDVTDEAAPATNQSAVVSPFPTVTSRVTEESFTPKTNGLFLTTQTTELSETILALQTSESGNIVSGTVQTVDQTIGPPGTNNTGILTIIFHAGGPSTIANAVTVHVCNGASDDPASIRDTILVLSPIPIGPRPRPRKRMTE
jgi:hypothetical protein